MDAATDAVGELLRVYDAAVESAAMMEDFYKSVVESRPVTRRMIRFANQLGSNDSGSS